VVRPYFDRFGAVLNEKPASVIEDKQARIGVRTAASAPWLLWVPIFAVVVLV
jgi:hypothetical protein